MDYETFDFITIIEVDARKMPDTLQQSPLLVSKRRNALQVIGVLPHGYKFQPASIEQADRLIEWLEHWKAQR